MTILWSVAGVTVLDAGNTSPTSAKRPANEPAPRRPDSALQPDDLLV